MAELLTKGGLDIKATSRSTAASKENSPPSVCPDKAQIGMTMGSTLYQAQERKRFSRMGNSRLALMNMYAAPQHLVTTTRTGIKTFADLKGKKISPMPQAAETSFFP